MAELIPDFNVKLSNAITTLTGVPFAFACKFIMCHFVFSAAHSPKAKQSTDAKTPSSAKDVKPSHSKTDKKSDRDRNASSAQSSQTCNTQPSSQSGHVDKLKTDDHNKELSDQTSKSGTERTVSRDNVVSKESCAENTTETQMEKKASEGRDQFRSATSQGNPAGRDVTKNQPRLSSLQEQLENTAASSAKVRTVSHYLF